MNIIYHKGNPFGKALDLIEQAEQPKQKPRQPPKIIPRDYPIAEPPAPTMTAEQAFAELRAKGII